MFILLSTKSQKFSQLYLSLCFRLHLLIESTEIKIEQQFNRMKDVNGKATTCKLLDFRERGILQASTVKTHFEIKRTSIKGYQLYCITVLIRAVLKPVLFLILILIFLILSVKAVYRSHMIICFLWSKSVDQWSVKYEHTGWKVGITMPEMCHLWEHRE